MMINSTIISNISNDNIIFETARCILQEHTDFETLNCLIADDNVASIRFAKKLEFSYIGRSCAAGDELGRYFLRLR